MANVFPLKPILVTCGLIFLAQAVVVWQILRRHHARRPMVLWTLGAIGAGLGEVCFGLRGMIPDWASFAGANVLLLGSMLIRTQALQALLAERERIARHWSAMALFTALYTLLWLNDYPQARVLVAMSCFAGGTAYLAIAADRTARVTRSVSATYLSRIEWVTAAVLGYFVAQGLLSSEPVVSLPQTWTAMAVVTMQALSALWSNLCFVGLVIDELGRAQQEAQAREVRQEARADRAEQATDQLRQALTEREALLVDRDRLLAVLAYEVRQPLHNASGVLAALRDLLGQPVPPTEQQLRDRIGHADIVLGDVREVLDNLLLVASLIQQPRAATMQSTELSFLVDLCLLDLPERQRQRVQVQYLAPPQSAMLSPPMMRLALRNLLRNAFVHGGGQVRVRLVIDRRAQDGHLLLSVVDDGPGLPERLAVARPEVCVVARPVTVTGDGATPGHGLGLEIVDRVMAAHGGRLVLVNRPEGGLCATLDMPLDAGPPDGPKPGIAADPGAGRFQ